MRKQFAAFLAAVAVTTTLATPAFADDGGVNGVLMIPVRLVAFGVGAVVGTPIAIVRKTTENACDMSEELSGKSENPIVRGVAGLAMLPFAVFKGGLEGVYYGTANSWKNSSEKPFSTDSFSLGEMGGD